MRYVERVHWESMYSDVIGGYSAVAVVDDLKEIPRSARWLGFDEEKRFYWDEWTETVWCWKEEK